jgi:hypothetical protein
VSVAVSFIILAMTWLTWISASIKVLGWIFLIAAILVLIDCFWSHRTVFTERRQRVVVQAPPQA